jgi:hypothetical protein
MGCGPIQVENNQKREKGSGRAFDPVKGNLYTIYYYGILFV